MPRTNEFTRAERERQDRFIRQCLDEQAVTLEQVMADQRVAPGDLLAWMRSRLFKRRMTRVRQQLAARREIEIDLAAVRAAARLSELAAAGAEASPLRQVWVDLVKLSRAATPASRSREATKSLVHPDVSPDEARQLRAQLEASAD
jgi:hypothetical protein